MLGPPRCCLFVTFVLLRATSAAIAHGNGDAAFWIVSTSESRWKNESLYLTTQGRDEGALRGWTYEQHVERKLHLIPVSGSDSTFYLVGTAESRKAGFLAYLDFNGRVNAWPYNPEVPEPQAQWRFEESAISADGLSYFIISTKGSRQPNEVLFFGDGGSVRSWGYDGKDEKCLWLLIPAPPSPPLPDYKLIMEEFNQNTIRGYLIVGGLIVACCLFGACKNRKPEQRRRTRQRVHHLQTQLSSGRLPVFGRPVAQADAHAVTGTSAGAVPVVQGVPMRPGNTTMSM